MVESDGAPTLHGRRPNRRVELPSAAFMWQIVGHEWAVDLLDRALQRQRIAHAYLFTGAPSIGKTHLAREFAAALNCENTERPCDTCRSCVRSRQWLHPDVLLVEPDGTRIKIDQVRQAQRELVLSPYEGRWRVCIITDFQLATPEAANALLKTLEEPPSRVVLILTAYDASTLLPTVVSRCQEMALRRVSTEQVRCALLERSPDTPDKDDLLARLAGGRVGWALRALSDKSLLETRRRDLDTLHELLHSGRAERITAAERLSEREDLPEALRLWQTWWRDLLVLLSGCQDLVTNVDCAASLSQVAAWCSVEQAHRAALGLESTLRQLEQNVNARLALEVLFAAWARPPA